jgi:hypothetical protein
MKREILLAAAGTAAVTVVTMATILIIRGLSIKPERFTERIAAFLSPFIKRRNKALIGEFLEIIMQFKSVQKVSIESGTIAQERARNYTGAIKTITRPVSIQWPVPGHYRNLFYLLIYSVAIIPYYGSYLYTYYLI